MLRHRGWAVYDLKRNGDNIYLLYTDSDWYYGMIYANLYIAASSDGGTTFKQQLISIPSKNGNHKTLGVQDQNYVPKLAAYKNEVYAVWSALDQDDQQGIIFRKSVDNGVTFTPAANLTKSTMPAGSVFQSGQETVEVRNGKVYVLFRKTDGKVYLTRSLDDGTSFQAPQLLTTSAYLTDGGSNPVVQLDPNDTTGTKLSVLWNPPQYVYSADSGATFTKPMLLSPQFSWRSIAHPKFVVASDGAIHWTAEGSVSWFSTGVFGDADIYYRRIDTPGPPSATNMSLRLNSYTNKGDGTGMERFDTMSVRPGPDLNFTSAMSAEIWVKPYADGITTGFTTIVKPIFHKRENSSAEGSPYLLGTLGDPINLQPIVIINTLADKVPIQTRLAPPRGMAILPPEKWVHLAFTYDADGGANNLRLYVGGKLTAAATATGDLATGDGQLLLGYFGSWEVDELRFWNRALSQSEITANVMSKLTGQEAGLTAYYNFDNTTRDLTARGNDGILMYLESFLPSAAQIASPVSVTAVKHAASYSDAMAPDSIVSLFGRGLAPADGAANTVPLPTNLLGTTVNVRDLNTRDRLAPLFYAGPGQINFAIPNDTYPGPVEITVNSSTGKDSLWTQLGKVAPGIFTANGSGRGAPAGSAVTVLGNGAQTFQNLFAVDLSPAVISLGNSTDQVYLVLYGTGLRGFSAKPTAMINGTTIPTTVTALPQFVGLDQVNLGPLPQSLRGAGPASIVISGDGQQSNPVTIAIQ